MYTKEQLQGMSDFEVNAELAFLAHKDVHSIYRNAPNKFPVSIFVELLSGDVACLAIKDYCKNWNDVMPLAVEHKLCIDWFTDGRCLVTQQNIKTDDIQYQSEDPQRAIACCLILVLQEQRK